MKGESLSRGTYAQARTSWEGGVLKNRSLRGLPVAYDTRVIRARQGYRYTSSCFPHIGDLR